MPVRTFGSVAELAESVGEHLGYSDWLEMTQKRIDSFADATTDHQWIHVDSQRAADGPFGTTIAHGYLTLALVVPLVGQVYRVDGVSMGINYGVNKVRFPTPVPVGSMVRAGAALAAAQPAEGGMQVSLDVVIQLQGGTKPACVAQTVVRYYT